MPAKGDKANKGKMVAHAIVFFCVAVFWLFIDQLSKKQFDDMAPDGIIGGPYAGLFQIRLVHNTGGAWGILSDSTVVLGVFSIAVCLVLIGYFFATIRNICGLQTIAVALVVGGGIGNAIDRFSQGFVIDFIELSFMDFPVFNIADIGVTCGIAFLMISLIFEWRRESRTQEA